MKKNIIKNILTAFAVAVMVVGFNGVKAKAKYVDWSEYDRSTCICETHDDVLWEKPECTSKRHLYGNRDSKIDEMIKVVKPILDNAPEAPHEAVKFFHDEICKRTSYSLDYSKYNLIDPYEVLSSGKAKCVGYAETFKLLCDIAGIPCKKVGGYSGSTPHAWNIVQLEDSEWYEVDCTADDTYIDGKISYNWFLITTKEMEKDHKRTRGDEGSENIVAKGKLYAYNKTPVAVNKAEYTITDKDSVEYTAAKKSVSGTITIPSTVKIGKSTYKVTSIAKNAFKGNKKIKKVVIGSNITKIGNSAFMNCTNLTTVDMSKCKAKTLQKNTFRGDRKLKKITLNGKELKTIKKDAFKNINSKCKITIKSPNSNKSSLIKQIKKAGADSCKIKNK